MSLAETCRLALDSLAKLARNPVNTTSAPVRVLRQDALSLHRLIHTTTTRLSVSLGKPPPSYPIAQVPLQDLKSQVEQLASCTCSFPRGVLRKEAIWAAEETILALESLVQYFESQCRRDEIKGEAYLAKTGAIHDAVVKAETMSKDETEAIIKAWKQNAEGLEDSLREVKEMMEEKEVEESDEGGGDGWDELGEGFGDKLSAEEMQRVKQVRCCQIFLLQASSWCAVRYILYYGSQQHFTRKYCRIIY